MGMGLVMTVLMLGMMVLMVGAFVWRLVSGRMRTPGRDRAHRRGRRV